LTDEGRVLVIFLSAQQRRLELKMQIIIQAARMKSTIEKYKFLFIGASPTSIIDINNRAC